MPDVEPGPVTGADGASASDAPPPSDPRLDLDPSPPPETSSPPEATAAPGSQTYRGMNDVHEWAAEVRRRYVEPKTRAMMREEGAITPRRRKRKLFGGPDSGDGNSAGSDTPPDA